MSYRPEKFLNYKQTGKSPSINFFDDKSKEDIRNLFLEVLYNGVHGFCFSLYEEGQKPGDIISGEQIRRRMKILSRYTGWIRSFSCIEGNELIHQIAKDFGSKAPDNRSLRCTPVQLLSFLGGHRLQEFPAAYAAYVSTGIR